jgi:HPt (histidine-containing phosphotransfer) domain-containing protein
MSESLDLAVINELKELLDESFSILIMRYIEDGQLRIEKIASALDVQDAAVVFAEAHGLKGSSRNIGAFKAGDIFCELETLGKVNNLATAATIFAAGKTEFSAVCTALSAQIA